MYSVGVFEFHSNCIYVARAKFFKEVKSTLLTVHKRSEKGLLDFVQQGREI